MINSDHVAYISTDLPAIPKTIREMRRRGIDEQTIRRYNWPDPESQFTSNF